MALPTFVAAGAASASVGAITPPLPAGIVADDILILIVETGNEGTMSITDQNGGTWAAVTNSPQGTGGADGTRLSVFWSRYNGTQGDPTTSDSGNHQIGRIFAFNGVITTGDPWDITSGNVDATSDTSLAATGATTTVADCLVVIAAGLTIEPASVFNATWTNADLANILVRGTSSTTAGNNGSIALVTGEKATAGAYGDTTNTLSTNSVKGMMTVALKPATGAILRTFDDTAEMADEFLKRQAMDHRDDGQMADASSKTLHKLINDVPCRMV